MQLVDDAVLRRGQMLDAAMQCGRRRIYEPFRRLNALDRQRFKAGRGAVVLAADEDDRHAPVGTYVLACAVDVGEIDAALGLDDDAVEFLGPEFLQKLCRTGGRGDLHTFARDLARDAVSVL